MMRIQSYGVLCLVIFGLRRSSALNCMTWDVVQDELYFIYRTDDFSNSVSLKDYDGDVTIICSFDQHSYHCHSFSTFGVIIPNINWKEIVFTIQDFNSKNVEGTWSVSQGGKTLKTTVSLSIGFIDSTDIYMTGEIDISKVTLGCYSCRPPHGYNVEFLVNGRSEDSLTLNYETGKCTHRIGECKPDLCSCSPSGNEFLRSFYSQETNKTATFSCNMVFVDVIADSRFSKYKTLFYDGTEIHPMDTITDIEYSSAENNGNKDKTKDNNEAECEGTLIGIVLAVVILFINVLLCVGMDKKSKTEHNTMILRPHRNEEITPLCLNTAPPCDELQSSKDEQVPQMNRQVEECVIRKQDEQVPQMNRQVDECVIRKEEKPCIDQIIFKQKENKPSRPFDVVFINFDVVIERNWVKRVTDMLEKKYDLSCGIIGRDFLSGLQMNNSFHFIEKHTPVVVTFSEKSNTMPLSFQFFENTDKLIVVIVEGCSPLFFYPNMKCVDATLDEEQWLKQLITALNIKKK